MLQPEIGGGDGDQLPAIADGDPMEGHNPNDEGMIDSDSEGVPATVDEYDGGPKEPHPKASLALEDERFCNCRRKLF